MEAMSDRLARENPARNNVVMRSIEMLVATLAYELARDFVRKLRESGDKDKVALGEHLTKLSGGWKAVSLKSEKGALKFSRLLDKRGIPHNVFGRSVCFPESVSKELKEILKDKNIEKKFGAELVDPLEREVMKLDCKDDREAERLAQSLKDDGIDAVREGSLVISKPTKEEMGRVLALQSELGASVASLQPLSPAEVVERANAGIEDAGKIGGMLPESDPARRVAEAKGALQKAEAAHDAAKTEWLRALESGDGDKIDAAGKVEAATRAQLGKARATSGRADELLSSVRSELTAIMAAPELAGASEAESGLRNALSKLCSAREGLEDARREHEAAKSELAEAVRFGDGGRIDAAREREGKARAELGQAQERTGAAQTSYDERYIEFLSEEKGREALKSQGLKGAEVLAATLDPSQAKAREATLAAYAALYSSGRIEPEPEPEGKDSPERGGNPKAQDAQREVSPERRGEPASESQIKYARELAAKGAISKEELASLGDSPTMGDASELISMGERRLENPERTSGEADDKAQGDKGPKGSPSLADQAMAAERREDIGNNQTTADYVQARPNSNDSDRSTPWSDGDDAPGSGDKDGDGTMDSAEDVDGDGTPDYQEVDEASEAEREDDERAAEDETHTVERPRESPSPAEVVAEAQSASNLLGQASENEKIHNPQSR